MVFEDIGALLFRDILKIYQYPGAPFTGNIINDLISYFFIPMVFVIFFIYMLLGRIVVGVKWLRLLMGLAIFLFMIVNGWFAMFALMAGPYFVFLIVVLGALYFIPSHFRLSHAHTGPTTEREGQTLLARSREIDEDLRKFEPLLAAAREKGSKDEALFYAEELNRLRREKRDIDRHRNPTKGWF
jgi:hypothetical protein